MTEPTSLYCEARLNVPVCQDTYRERLRYLAATQQFLLIDAPEGDELTLVRRETNLGELQRSLEALRAKLRNYGYVISYWGVRDVVVESSTADVREPPRGLDWYQEALGEAQQVIRRLNEERATDYVATEARARNLQAHLGRSFQQYDDLHKQHEELLAQLKPLLVPHMSRPESIQVLKAQLASHAKLLVAARDLLSQQGFEEDMHELEGLKSLRLQLVSEANAFRCLEEPLGDFYRGTTNPPPLEPQSMPEIIGNLLRGARPDTPGLSLLLLSDLRDSQNATGTSDTETLERAARDTTTLHNVQYEVRRIGACLGVLDSDFEAEPNRYWQVLARVYGLVRNAQDSVKFLDIKGLTTRRPPSKETP